MYPKVVLFDLDGTLLDNSPQVVEAYHRGASALGYTISRELISQQAGKSTFETSRAMGIPEEHHAEMDAYFWQYFGELTADPSTDFTILDGVPELLSALKSQSIIMGVVTSNRADYARTMLERTNLLHYFNVVVGKETVAEVKPHPLPVLHALEQMGVQPRSYTDVWFVGDTASDAVAAKAAGIRSISLPQPSTLQSVQQSIPHQLFFSPAQLQNYFSMLHPEPVSSPFAIVIDFDGTITTKDVSEEILRQFAVGDWKKIEDDAIAGLLTMDECMIQQYGLLRGDIEEWLQWGRQIGVRPGFADFLVRMHTLGIEVVCVSAGLDFVIQDFIRRHNWTLSVIAPATIYRDNSVQVIPVPHPSDFVDFKEHQVLSRSEQFRIIYIGDGSSDFEGAKHAEICFAIKDSRLSQFLTEFGKKHSTFEDFNDLRDQIEDLISSLSFQG